MSLTSGAFAVLPGVNPLGTTSEAQVAEVQQITLTVKSEDYEPLSDPKNVERFLGDYFADMPLMAKIAKCESRNRHYDKNGSVLRGEVTPLDRGVMQINLYYHEGTAVKLGLDLHNIDDNVAYARYLYEKQGAKPWMSSSACWSKFSEKEIAKK